MNITSELTRYIRKHLCKHYGLPSKFFILLEGSYNAEYDLFEVKYEISIPSLGFKQIEDCGIFHPKDKANRYISIGDETYHENSYF